MVTMVTKNTPTPPLGSGKTCIHGHKILKNVTINRDFVTIPTRFNHPEKGAFNTLAGNFQRSNTDQSRHDERGSGNVQVRHSEID